MYCKWLFNNDWLCKNVEKSLPLIYNDFCFFLLIFFWVLLMLPSLFEIFVVIFRHFDVSDQLWLFVLYIFNFVCLGSGMFVLNNQWIMCEVLDLIKKNLTKRLRTFCVYRKFENSHHFPSINQSIINLFVILF